MTSWRAPTWRPLDPHELLDPETARNPKARFELWTKSPSGLPVGASGQGLDLALLALHMRGFNDEVYGVLDKMSDEAMSCTAAIDFFIGYDMFGHVARHLEKFASACEYVLELPPSKDADLDERITRARDMARTSLAKRYAIEAISEMGMGS
jgi:hypothetical protein